MKKNINNLFGSFFAIAMFSLFLMSQGVNAVGGLLIMRDGNDDSVVNISESGTTDTVDLFFDPPVTKGGYPNPTADIIVTCTLQDAAQATLSPSTFTFNASNYGTPPNYDCYSY